MAKRISRKLLVGLGSVVTFGAVGTVSGFGVKSIIDSTLNHNQVNQLAQTFPEGSYTELANYNVATRDMFIDTTDLRKFHFGNTQIGQKITPWGWLGVFESGNKKSKIALTGWNGEIIWVNDDYGNQSDTRYNVYDMQYDWNTNLLLVLRTNADNGFYEPGQGNNPVPVQLDILDAKTGKKFTGSSIDSAWFSPFQKSAINKLDDNFLKDYDRNQNLKNKSKNLYYLDVAFSKQQKALLATWMPNYMQMADQNKSSSTFSLPTFYDVIMSWTDSAASALLKLDLVAQNKDAKYKKQFILTRSFGITWEGGDITLTVDDGGTNVEWNTKDIYLLTNPFFTTSDDGNAFLMHLIGAKQDGTVVHKSIGWKIVFGVDANGEIYKKETFDKPAQKWSNNGFLELQGNGSWAKAKGWRNEFINANLRVNKNMFNYDSVVFAYPFGTSSHFPEGKMMPSFNVAQVKINSDDGSIDTKTKEKAENSTINYGFASQINKYYDQNQSKYNTTSVNNIYPVPDSNASSDNINHSYNRLISVSPFDNTVIYAAKPNIRDNIFDQYNTNNKNKWAGFWIANSWAYNQSKRYYRPLIVGADSSISNGDIFNNGNSAQQYMLSNVNDLYWYGFTFDIKSLIIKNSTPSLNLYFNQTGNGVNDSYSNNGLRSSKIGLLNDVIKQGSSTDNTVWVSNVAEKNPKTLSAGKNIFATGINKKSYANIIHSRADLKKWYIRSWTNLNRPGNMFPATENNKPKVINEAESSNERAIADRFDSQLSDSTKANTNNSVDLVSAWLDKGDQKPTPNYDRLAAKRPKIRIGDGPSERTNRLGLVTEYNLVETVESDFLKKKAWSPTTNTGNLSLTKVDTVDNVSYQIVSSWEKQYKMLTIQDTTDKLAVENNARWHEVSAASWQDKILSSNLAFGSTNNNVARNNKTPLRLMLKLVKPTGTLPNWFGKNFDNYFEKAYPIVPFNDTETSFSQMVKEYANKKASLIDLSDPNNAAVSLGNLKIEAYLELNPGYTGSQKIYYDGNKPQRNTKRYLQDSSGGIVIYEDLSDPANHLIYDQSQIEYDKFQEGGFGKDAQSAVRKSIEKSWKPGAINRNFQIKVSTDYNQLPDTLVRKNANDRKANFSFAYKKGDKSKIEITPTDVNWFKNHFQNFNRMLNLFVQFQYSTDTTGNNWTSLGTFLTDQQIKSQMSQNGVLTLNNVTVQNIKRIRYKLTAKPNDANDPNLSIDIQNFNGSDNKYISNHASISIQTFTINNEWIKNKTLTNASKILNSISDNDINTYINSVISSSPDASNAELKKQVTLKFTFNGKSNLDANTLLREIQSKLEGPEPFALWNGTNGQKLIIAKFELLTNDGSIEFVKPDGTNPNSNDLNGEVKSDLKTEVNLNDYIDQLMNDGLTVNPPPTVQGTFQNGGQDIQFPTNLSNLGFFAQMSFNDIKTKLLDKLGVKLRFKDYDPNTGLFGAWKDELNQITKYNPADPMIQIGFQITANWNTKLVKDATEITDVTVFPLRLALPKLVKIPTDINKLITEYNTKNVFSNNTFQLTVNNHPQAKELVARTLAKASASSNQENQFYNDLMIGNRLTLKYQIGDFQNNKWFTENELKTELAKNQNDLSNNELRMKIELGSDAKNIFVLEQKLANQIFTLLSNGNQTVKIYVHGTALEQGLQQGISVTGSKQQLQYTLPSALNVFSNQNGKYDAKKLTLQYQLVNSNNQTVGNWTNGYMPSRVDANVKAIKVKIISDKTISNNHFVYGPELNQNQQIATIDLSQISSIIKVDQNWLTNSFNEMEIKSFANKSFLNQWITELRNKIKTLNNLTDDTLVNEIDIEFTLENNVNQKLNVDNFIRVIENILTNYQSTNLGIIRLWNQDINAGIKVNATFKSKTNKVILADTSGNTNGNLSGLLNTSAIYTQIDISSYATRLETVKTQVNPKTGGKPNEITGFTPPAGQNSGGIFHNKDYDTIAARLKAVGIDIKFSQNGTSGWTDKNNINQYEPTKRKLFLSFSNIVNNNLRLIVKSSNPQDPEWIVMPDETNTSVLTLPLEAPKQISINADEIAFAIQQINFGGNTKNITFNQDSDRKVIEKIKLRNKQENGNDTEYDSMPLTIKFNVGDTSDYKSLTDLKTYLAGYPDDFTNRAIKYKFEITGAQANQWIFAPSAMTEGYLHNDDNNSPLKIYINDKNIFNDLSKTKIAPGGTNTQFNLQWQNGITVNSANGSLSGSRDGNKPKGQGLRIEFTFNSTLTGKENTGTDIYNDWVKQQPTSVNPGYDKLFVRIKIEDPKKYDYDKVDQKNEISLDIKQILQIEGSALNKVILDQKIESINQLTKQKFIDYENKVWAVAKIPANLKNEVKIEYQFKGKKYFNGNDSNTNLDALISVLNNYETTSASEVSLGILQLWNGVSGEKITTSFQLVNPNNPKLELQVNAPNFYDLDFANFISVIDFANVIQWLKNLELKATNSSANNISNIIIPDVNINEKFFKNKTWAQVTAAFSGFGITIQYSNDIVGEQENWGTLNSVNKFDPNKGTFLMRFTFDRSKSKNIKLKTGTEQLDGSTAINSNSITLKLKVRLTINLKPELLTEFKNTANITGDTKNIEINEALKAEQQLIQKIKDNNGDRYQNAQLSLQYYLGTQIPNDTQWISTLTELKNSLSRATTDQNTNKIWYRFRVANTSDFSVDQTAQVLSDHQPPESTQSLKIKYYINGDTLESSANNIVASGLNDHISWNFNDVFGRNNVVENNQSEVLINTPAGPSLKIYFTLAPGGDNYNSPNDSSDNPKEINTKWVSKKPQGLPAGTQGLRIKLVPVNQNYVYGPKESSKAKAHNVSLQFKSKIVVNKNWLALDELSNTSIEITNINKTIFDQWEEKIYNQIKDFNKTTIVTAKKVKIKYLFDTDQTVYDSAGILQKIQTKNYGDNSLGITQLWNGTNGSKIQVFFNVDANTDIVLRTEDNPDANNNPNQSDLQNQLKTNNIYTEVNLTTYVNDVLIRNKTEVSSVNNSPGKITDFTPPGMSGTVGASFLSGKTYEQISNRLKELGTTIEFSKDGTANSVWQPKEKTKEYDIQKNALFLAFTITSSNLKIRLNTNQIIEVNNSNKNSPIKLELNVPKYIVISNSKNYWQGIEDKFNFNGDTKNIDFNKSEIDKFLDAIREDNYQASGGDQNGDAAYKQAPLEIMFQVGSSKFTEVNELKKYLSSIQTDLPERSIRIKFRIKADQENQWKLQRDDEYEFLNEQATPNQISKIKIFINDNDNFNQMKQMQLKGSQENLVWPWPFGANGIDENTGILTPQPGGFGKGLKLQFSFNENAQNEGKNPETEWVGQTPKTFKPKYNKVWVRIKLTNDSLYKYDYADSQFSLSLDDIPKIIKLDSNWLNFQFDNSNNFDVKDLVAKVETYKTAVMNAAKTDTTNPVDTNLLDKFIIKYQFDGANNNAWLTQQELIDKIQDYSKDKNQASLGILQLWNNSTGVKINGQFFDANISDKYEIQIINNPNNPHTIDTSNVQTHIDFSKVMSWIQSKDNLIKIEPGQSANSISKLIFPNYQDQSDSIFNNIEWNKMEQALKTFGINLEYRSKSKNGSGSFGPLSSVTSYDPTFAILEFQIRFDNTKAKNMFIKLNAAEAEIPGTSTTNPGIFEAFLDVPLSFVIEDQKVQDLFINVANVISGNTKNITISEADQNKLIDEIIKLNGQNNPIFSDPQYQGALIIEYYLGDTTNDKTHWKDLKTFKQDLALSQTDQTSNKVWFRFNIKAEFSNKFSVSDNPYLLHNPDTDPKKWKIQFYINAAQWEQNAANVLISGKTSNIRWNYDSLATGTNIIKEPVGALGQKVFIKINGRKALQVQFSTKENIQYNDQSSDDLTDLNNKWITIEPKRIEPPENVQHLFIRLVAADGFVYGPQENNNAQRHKIDETKLKIEIEVDPTILSRSLTVNAPNAFVTDITKKDLEEYVQEVKNHISPVLSEHVVVVFHFNNKVFDGQIAGKKDQEKIINDLLSEIKRVIGNNNAPDYGILQLWNDQTGKKIEANYSLKDPNGNYSLIDKNRVTTDPDDIGKPETKKTLVTGHIKTLIDLKEIITALVNEKINVNLKNKSSRGLTTINGLGMPTIPNVGNSGLKGLDWNTFETILKNHGILIEARPVDGNNNQLNWKPIDQIKEYDPTTLKLELRFKIEPKGSNVVLSIKKDQDVEMGAPEADLPTFEMILNAPAQVVVDATYLTEFINSNKISGNTKNIQMDTEADKQLVDKIIEANIKLNANVFSKLKGRLEIQYYLGKQASSNLNDWRNHNEFTEYLKKQTVDFDTNKIWYRFNIKPDDQDDQIFQIDQNPKELIPEQIDDNAKVKIFVNDTGFVQRITTLKAIGATDNFQIEGYDQWLKSIPKSLEVQYSNSESPDEKTDTDWSTTLPSSLNSNKKLWVRFKTKDGYVFEKAKQDPQGSYTKYSDKYPINTSELRLILKLQKAWLEEIQITGNTVQAQIDEAKVLEKIKTSGILPTGQDDLIVLEYAISGTNQWMNKDDFQNHLKTLKGAKDNNNFILKREELEVRFALKNPDGNYGLNVDNTIITNENRDQFNVKMVEDGKRNDSFEGYINVDLLKQFRLENFEVKGTTSKPRFIVHSQKELDTLFAPYVSDGLFDIQFAYQVDNKGDWIWEEKNTILNQGKLIDEQGLIKLGVNIGANRKFALKFISKNTKYQVYKDDNKEERGYTLDISSNVRIVVEITNPFSAAGKTLGIWTRDDSKQAKYFQGEGGFKIVVANKSTLEVEQTNIQSAQEFLNGAQGLQQNEKDALEFVYHNFGASATSAEIEQIQKTINDYNSNDWQAFPQNNKANDSNWSGDLKLKVGDYVAVAIRVKKQYATGENAFILKNDDYSMILPQMTNDQGQQKTPGRLSGYKIRTSAIAVDEKSIILTSMVNPELPPLDGWTWLSKLNLKQDEKSNYLGVNLKLQLYSEFHEKSGKILISGSGAKLIKRNSTGSNISENGTYKDSSGQDITDDTNKPVKIYKDKTTNRLSEPIKSSTPTTESMSNLGEGIFRLDKPTDSTKEGKLSLFKNQDIDLKLEANQGQGTTDLPDYYLDDNDKTINLRDLINPKIKYPIENEKKITYEWNYDDFGSDKISYKGLNGKDPEDGAAQIATIFKLFKKQGNSAEKEEISGQTIDEAINKLNETLKTDFDDQLQFETTRLNANGGETVNNDNNIYKFNDLKNKDRIVLKIVAKANDLYYAEAPRPLIINVNGLTEAAPTQDKLQYLRVKQGGLINGQGSFKVLVSDPNDDNEDDQSILKGWKFMVRVWDHKSDENGKRKIKIDWTDDQARIRGLANDDKVEWKLVSEDGNPVKEAYYNTIALEHQSNADGSIKYNFAQIQYQNGDSTYQKVKDGIGAYPENDEYPENSGFIISGLKSAIETFKISKENFAKVMAQLQPSYVGINTQGTIHFDQKYFDENYWVNTNGELYVKKDQATFKDQSINEIGEIPLTEFLDHVTFYTHDPVIANYQGGFKFSGNDININNHLTNGDQMWATFDTTKVNDDSGLIVNDPTTSVVTQLLDVSGLKDIIDPMSPLWYVLMALAGIATLGTAALIAFLVARHKKLKGKN